LGSAENALSKSSEVVSCKLLERRRQSSSVGVLVVLLLLRGITISRHRYWFDSTKEYPPSELDILAIGQLPAKLTPSLRPQRAMDGVYLFRPIW
jgi:hypothetical protein